MDTFLAALDAKQSAIFWTFTISNLLILGYLLGQKDRKATVLNLLTFGRDHSIADAVILCMGAGACLVFLVYSVLEAAAKRAYISVKNSRMESN